MAEKFTCPFCESNITLEDLRAGKCLGCGAIIEENSKKEICFYPPEDSFSKDSDEQKGLDASIKTAPTADNSKTVSYTGASHTKTLNELCAEQGLTLDGTTVKKCDKNATSVIIPEGVTEIRTCAFQHHAALKSVEIPGSVIFIGASAFYGCSSLEKVTISEGVKTIESAAFRACPSLTSVNIPASAVSVGKRIFMECTALVNVEIANGVKTLGESMFFGCKSLARVNIPKSVKNIGSSVFVNCNSLVDIAVDMNNTAFKSIDGNLYLKYGSTLIQYALGKREAEFTIPEGVTVIADSAFRGCTSLTGIAIPKSVSSIGNCAFWECTSLTGVVIPEGVTSIGERAFYSCKSLASVDIPRSISLIKSGAFEACEGLTKIRIPSDDVTLGSRIFMKCKPSLEITVKKSRTKKQGWDKNWNAKTYDTGLFAKRYKVKYEK